MQTAQVSRPAAVANAGSRAAVSAYQDRGYSPALSFAVRTSRRAIGPPSSRDEKPVGLQARIAFVERLRGPLDQHVDLGRSDHQRRRDDHPVTRSEEHTSELQSRENLVCRLLLE